MVQLQILGITYSQVQAGAYALILAEVNGKRRVPVIIGTSEAQSIAIFLEGLKPPRPLTHDLFAAFSMHLECKLVEVQIAQYIDGIFHSELIFEKDDELFKMTARTSDAIALAVRMNAPIFMSEEILQEVGIIIEDMDMWEGENPAEQKAVPFESMNLEELQTALQTAIANESYEDASYIRDLIKQKQG
jgi:bifunctional DNase/RNase